ncbi:hypothetical protein TWF751_005218 [Orbilia oligospora]|nr:hypothetical protein TWF751_005218 [Orbilia oligospora]
MRRPGPQFRTEVVSSWSSTRDPQSGSSAGSSGSSIECVGTYQTSSTRIPHTATNSRSPTNLSTIQPDPLEPPSSLSCSNTSFKARV